MVGTIEEALRKAGTLSGLRAADILSIRKADAA
jgi:hypothetical protein